MWNDFRLPSPEANMFAREHGPFKIPPKKRFLFQASNFPGAKKMMLVFWELISRCLKKINTLGFPDGAAVITPSKPALQVQPCCTSVPGKNRVGKHVDTGYCWWFRIILRENHRLDVQKPVNSDIYQLVHNFSSINPSTKRNISGSKPIMGYPFCFGSLWRFLLQKNPCKKSTIKTKTIKPSLISTLHGVSGFFWWW